MPNLHQQKLTEVFKQNYPHLLDSWHKGVTDRVDLETTIQKSLKIENILKSSLDHKHFPEDAIFDSVKKLLRQEITIDDARKEVVTKVQELRQKIEVEDAKIKKAKIIKANKKLTQEKIEAAKIEEKDAIERKKDINNILTAISVPSNLLKLLDPNLKQDLIEGIVANIIKRLPSDAELKNDLISFIPKKVSSLNSVALLDTDNPMDIFLCGSEVVGSCQKVDGDPKLNRGLLGYLLNGHTRLLAIKKEDSPDSPIVARAIIRLQLNSENEPVMQMEHIYPSKASREVKEALTAFAIKRAETLGLDLVSAEKIDTARPYPFAISNYGGFAPEYVDAMQGIKEGKYTIDQTYQLNAKPSAPQVTQP